MIVQVLKGLTRWLMRCEMDLYDQRGDGKASPSTTQSREKSSGLFFHRRTKECWTEIFRGRRSGSCETKAHSREQSRRCFA